MSKNILPIHLLPDDKDHGKRIARTVLVVTSDGEDFDVTILKNKKKSIELPDFSTSGYVSRTITSMTVFADGFVRSISLTEHQIIAFCCIPPCNPDIENCNL